MPRILTLRALLWIDCTGAAIVGVGMLALARALEPLFGLPRQVLLATAAANLAYGAFSFSLARMPEPSARRVRALIAANAAWTIVCVALVVMYAARPSLVGVVYLLLEGGYVGLLAAAEARALAVARRG